MLASFGPRDIIWPGGPEEEADQERRRSARSVSADPKADATARASDPRQAPTGPRARGPAAGGARGSSRGRLRCSGVARRHCSWTGATQVSDWRGPSRICPVTTAWSSAFPAEASRWPRSLRSGWGLLWTWWFLEGLARLE